MSTGGSQNLESAYDKIKSIYEMRDDLMKNHLKKIADYTEM